MDPNPRAWNQNGSYSEYMMQGKWLDELELL